MHSRSKLIKIDLLTADFSLSFSFVFNVNFYQNKNIFRITARNCKKAFRLYLFGMDTPFVRSFIKKVTNKNFIGITSTIFKPKLFVYNRLVLSLNIYEIHEFQMNLYRNFVCHKPLGLIYRTFLGI
jgi:hypothetical protein